MMGQLVPSGSVFISYARSDGREHAEHLYRELTRRGIMAWRDERDLDPYLDFSVEIEKGIRQASHVVVCLTPSINQRPESFVRREILYAQGNRKPVIPLLFPGAEPIVLINHLTWIPFVAGEPPGLDFEGGLQRLLDRLAASAPLVPSPSVDPCREYLEALYEEIVDFLDTTVFSLLSLRSQVAPQAAVEGPPRMVPVRIVARPLRVREKSSAPQEFSHASQAFAHFKGRLLLLGEPGSGKSTVLWALAREAVVARLADPEQPLPVLAQVASWDARTAPPFSAWLSQELDVRAAIEEGRALLLLDGLDELGHPEQGDDPRQRFLDRLPEKGQILLTCRTRDFEEIRAKTRLNGAVTLQPLTDEQIAAYLMDRPELLAAVKADKGLREMMRTPLLLSLLAYAYSHAGDRLAELRDLSASPGELRDRIFRTYVERRYEHESNKPNAALVFSLERMNEVLGELALRDAARRTGVWALGTLESDLGELLGEDAPAFVEQAARLHLLILVGGQCRFIHLRLRDFFGLPAALRKLKDGDPLKRLRAVAALGEIADARAIDPLDDLANAEGSRDILFAVPVLGTDSLFDAALRALAKIGSPRAGALLAKRSQSQDLREKRAAIGALATIADERKLTPEEEAAAISTLSQPDLRTAFRGTDTIERGGSPEAIEALLRWEERYFRKLLGRETAEDIENDAP